MIVYFFAYKKQLFSSQSDTFNAKLALLSSVIVICIVIDI